MYNKCEDGHPSHCKTSKHGNAKLAGTVSFFTVTRPRSSKGGLWTLRPVAGSRTLSDDTTDATTRKGRHDVTNMAPLGELWNGAQERAG